MSKTTATEAMAKTDIAVAQDAVARGTEFYKMLQEYALFIKKFSDGYKDLHFNVISLINEREHLRAENRRLEISRSKVEEEAKLRLENIRQGNKAVIDKLSKKEIELANKIKDLEQREAMLTAKNREVELLKLEYERRLSVSAELAR